MLLLRLGHVAPCFAEPCNKVTRCTEIQHDEITKLQSTTFIKRPMVLGTVRAAACMMVKPNALHPCHGAPRFAKPHDEATSGPDVHRDMGTQMQAPVIVKMLVAARTHSNGCRRFCTTNCALPFLHQRHVAPRFAKPSDNVTQCIDIQHHMDCQLQITVVTNLQTASTSPSSHMHVRRMRCLA